MDVLTNVYAVDAAGVRQLALSAMLGIGANLRVQYDNIPSRMSMCVCI